MNKILIGIVSAILITGISVWFIIDSDNNKLQIEDNSGGLSQSQTVESALPLADESDMVAIEENEIETVIVTYIDGRFDPEMIGPISPNTNVEFFNESSQDVWIASDNHPTHLEVPGFDSGAAISPGEKYEFTFEEAGNWGYHNHLNPSEKGTVQVGEE